MAVDGIQALINVSQTKVDNANDNALDGAKKQQGLVKEEQKAHAQESNLEDYVRNKDLTDDDYWKINRMLQSDHLSIKGVDDGWDGILGNMQSDGHWHAKLDPSHADATAGKNSDIIDDIKQRFSNYDQDLQSQDKMGNFEVQSLMSDFNEAQTLASSVLKKKDDTGNATIGKI
jgi:hypothetical protein